MICSQCREVHYCNRICQKAHWSEHNQACREAPTKRKVPSVVKRAHLVFLFEPNMEGYELDPMKKFYSPRHVYAQHKFLKGQHLTGSGKDLAYLSNSCPPEGPEWNALLDHSISDADQDLLWQVYWRKVSAIANVQLSVDDDVLALHDVPVDGELSMNAPGRWLAIQIHQFICNMIWMKYSFVPKEVIDNPDPQCKEEYWTKEIEPEIKLLIRPQCFTIVGGFRRDQLKLLRLFLKEITEEGPKSPEEKFNLHLTKLTIRNGFLWFEKEHNEEKFTCPLDMPMLQDSANNMIHCFIHKVLSEKIVLKSGVPCH